MARSSSPCTSSQRLRAVLAHLVADLPGANGTPGRLSALRECSARAAQSAGASSELAAPMTFSRGPTMQNRFMLAPLTNEQSGADGVLSDDEYSWLVKRAEGGFGLTMTCASHVQRIGQGFNGQLGCWSDDHLEGLTRLASGIQQHGSISVVQLHHAGIRSPLRLIGEAPVGPSEDEQTGSRALSTAEVEQLIEDFIVGAERCEAAGFDGVELHGAHGYILCQFLSDETNRRTDRYGGCATNRERIVREIIAGIRSRCRNDFNVGIRLSPERFGIQLGETLAFVQALCNEGELDYIDLSLWDSFKDPTEEEFQSKPLMHCGVEQYTEQNVVSPESDRFSELDRGDCRLGVAGKIMTTEEAQACLDAGMDFVLIGRGAILHHDYPRLAMADPAFEPIATPVSEEHLLHEGLSETFVKYMSNWAGFVEGGTEGGRMAAQRGPSSFEQYKERLTPT